MKTIFSNKIKLTVLLLLMVASSNSYSKESSKPFPASNESPEGMITLQNEKGHRELLLQRNIVYTKYGDFEAKFHLITPGLAPNRNKFKSNGKPVPLVIFVPGSAWFPQNLDRSILKMADFSRQSGYAIAIVAYRPSTMAKSPAQLIDIKTSIRFIRARAKKFNIDPEKIAIWGTSSGAHIASLVGLTENLKKFETGLYLNHRSDVKAVVNFFGPSDFRRMDDFPGRMRHNSPDSPESIVIGGPIQDPENLAKVKEYNPISYVSAEKQIPPFLMMHGDLDPLVPFNQSVLLYEALRNAGKDVTFYKLKDAGHGDRFFSPKPMKIVQEFIDKQFH